MSKIKFRPCRPVMHIRDYNHWELCFHVEVETGEIWAFDRADWNLGITQEINDGEVIEFKTGIHSSNAALRAVNAIIEDRGGRIEHGNYAIIRREIVSLLENAFVQPKNKTTTKYDRFTEGSWLGLLNCLRLCKTCQFGCAGCKVETRRYICPHSRTDYCNENCMHNHPGDYF